MFWPLLDIRNSGKELLHMPKIISHHRLKFDRDYVSYFSPFGQAGTITPESISFSIVQIHCAILEKISKQSLCKTWNISKTAEFHLTTMFDDKNTL